MIFFKNGLHFALNKLNRKNHSRAETAQFNWTKGGMFPFICARSIFLLFTKSYLIIGTKL